MYMNIPEFRANLRKAFNTAEIESVFITRHDQTFELRLVNKKRAVSKSPGLYTLEELLVPNPKPNPSTVGTCPHGYGKGMCKRPDCNMKYRL